MVLLPPWADSRRGFLSVPFGLPLPFPFPSPQSQQSPFRDSNWSLRLQCMWPSRRPPTPCLHLPLLLPEGCAGSLLDQPVPALPSPPLPPQRCYHFPCSTASSKVQSAHFQVHRWMDLSGMLCRDAFLLFLKICLWTSN